MNNLHETLAEIENFFSKKQIEIQAVNNQIRVYFDNGRYFSLSIDKEITVDFINNDGKNQLLKFVDTNDFFQNYEKLFFRSHLREK